MVKKRDRKRLFFSRVNTELVVLKVFVKGLLPTKRFFLEKRMNSV